MNTFITILLSLVTIGFIVLVFYAVITLIQIKQTAKEVQETLKKVNLQLDNMNKIISIVSSITSSIPPVLLPVISFLGGSIGLIVKKIFSFRRKINERK